MRSPTISLVLVVGVAMTAHLVRVEAGRAVHTEDYEEEEEEDGPEFSSVLYAGAGPAPCGLTPARNKTQSREAGGASRIIQGLDQTYGEFPSFVSLRDARGRVQCGGTLISARLVLTAAHCVARSPTLWGWHALLGPRRPARRDYVAAASVTPSACVAPDYRGASSLANDWALVQLASEAPLNDYVQPACVPTEDTLLSYGTCWLVGAGTRAFAGPGGRGPASVGERVQKMRVELRECPRSPDSWQTVCYAPEDNARAGMCFGDTGGPVLCEGDHGRATVVAVASGGYFDASCDSFKRTAQLPGLYLDVSQVEKKFRSACAWMFA